MGRNYRKIKPVRPKERFLVFGSPVIGDAEIAEVTASLHSGWLGTGPKVARFERNFAAYKSASHVAAVNSCTAALHLSMLAAGLKPGDEVITTAMTFCATVNAIIHAQADPVLADIDPVSLNIDPVEVEKKVTPRTRAIVPVHFAGRACDMDALMEIAHRHNLIIIEDCAHAIETEYKGLKTGTLGNFGCFSFYVTKNIVTGEGGMVLARDENAIAHIKRLALHGMSQDAWHRYGDEGFKHYQVVECGYKYNMMDLQAAIGIHQLKQIEKYWNRRREIWEYYQSSFSNLPFSRPAPTEPQTRHAHHLYTLLIDEEQAGLDRDSFLAGMTYQNIGVGVHYRSITEHPFYQRHLHCKPHDCPVALDVGRRTVSLPLSAGLNDEDVENVIEAVKRVLDAPT